MSQLWRDIRQDVNLKRTKVVAWIQLTLGLVCVIRLCLYTAKELGGGCTALAITLVYVMVVLDALATLQSARKK